MNEGYTDPVRRKIQMLTEPSYPLCREDVIWMLDFIKKKVADKDPHLLDLSQPRLLQHYHCFAETALLLIRKHTPEGHEAAQLKQWLLQASFGLWRDNPPLDQPSP
jgi:hypothetical protein